MNLSMTSFVTINRSLVDGLLSHLCSELLLSSPRQLVPLWKLIGYGNVYRQSRYPLSYLQREEENFLKCVMVITCTYPWKLL